MIVLAMLHSASMQLLEAAAHDIPAFLRFMTTNTWNGMGDLIGARCKVLREQVSVCVRARVSSIGEK